MSLQKYEAHQLNSIFNSLLQKKANGILNLKTQVNSQNNQRQCILIFCNGELVYGDTQIFEPPNNKDFCRMLGNKLKPNIINAALAVASEKIDNSTSTKELVGLLTRMRIFTWQEVENLMMTKVILILEKFLPYGGEVQWQESTDFDFSYDPDNHGLNWSKIQQQLSQRQKIWQSYAPAIPNIDAIPVVTQKQLQHIDNSQVKEHLRNFVDGQQTLSDIAVKMDKDPLKVAKSYLNWVNKGWVGFGAESEASKSTTNVQSAPPADTTTQSTANQNLPTVLSVDDSPIIQLSIKRALQEQYTVLLADKAMDALAILHQQPVKLLLLDLTMPDVDGLAFCKKIRTIPQFQDLPIIMVTARDGLVNKMKGHIAGTNKYLTKPFKPEELQAIVRQYISQ